MLVGLIQSFADHFDPTNLVNLLNEILDLRFEKKYNVVGPAVTATIFVHLRSLLAGSVNVVSGVATVPINLWDILDGAVPCRTARSSAPSHAPSSMI